jgi:ureidoglycolate lyase
MNITKLVAKPLTKVAFSEFGDVIEKDGAKHFPINEGAVERFHDLADIQVDTVDGGKAIVSFFQVTTPSFFPYQFNLIERHPKGSQAFIPTDDKPVVLVVGAPTDNPQAENLHAFITNGKQGFNFHTGVWHMPLISEEVGRTFVIIDRSGPGNNCDEVTLENNMLELVLA